MCAANKMDVGNGELDNGRCGQWASHRMVLQTMETWTTWLLTIDVTDDGTADNRDTNDGINDNRATDSGHCLKRGL